VNAPSRPSPGSATTAPGHCCSPRASPPRCSADWATTGSGTCGSKAGPTLAAAFLRSGLVDRVIAYVAPALLGSGRPPSATWAGNTIADLRRFTLTDVTRIGADVRMTLVPLTDRGKV
jgi:hypothetical protein